MSRTELMAIIALAAGMSLTVALIASPESAEGEGADAAFFDPSRFLGWLGSDETELLAATEGGRPEAY